MPGLVQFYLAAQVPLYNSFSPPQISHFLTLSPTTEFIMPPFSELAVAHFIQTSLSTCASSSDSRWAITVTFSSAKSSGSVVYQISGTHTDYALATPASVTLSLPPSESMAFGLLICSLTH